MALGFGFGFPATPLKAAGGASLALNFLSAPLDPSITFSRTSNATLTGSNGLIQYAPHNTLLYSEQFDNAAWTKTNATVTANAVIAPDGTTTGDALVEDSTATVRHQLTAGIVTLLSSSKFSCYMKKGARSYGALGLNTGEGAIFDLVNGTITDTTGSPNADITSVGNGWFRCVISTPASSITCRIGISNTAVAAAWSFGIPVYNGDGTSGIYIWGAQLNVGSLQPYYPTTTAAYYGPRFDYDPITLACKGLLIEEQRVNLLTYSSDYSNTSLWGRNATGLTTTGSYAAAPDGTLTASRLQGTINTWFMQQVVTTTIGSPYTVSFYVRSNTGASQSFRLYGDGNILSSDLVATTSWKRFSHTYTPIQASAGAGICRNVAGDLNDLQIWGAQVEAGAFATSYIPTVASQVTRTADNASMTGTNFSSWYNQSEGTLFSNGSEISVTSPTNRNMLALELDNANYITLVTNTVGQLTSGGQVGGASQWSLTNSTTVVAGQDFKVSLAFKVNDIALVYNAGTPVTDTIALIPAPTKLGIGQLPFAGQYFNGTIKSISYYPRRLTNAELQAITA